MQGFSAKVKLYHGDLLTTNKLTFFTDLDTFSKAGTNYHTCVL